MAERRMLRNVHAQTGALLSVVNSLNYSDYAHCHFWYTFSRAQEVAELELRERRQPISEVNNPIYVAPTRAEHMMTYANAIPNPMYGGGSATPTRAANNAESSKWFYYIDSDNDGFITGEEVRTFFMESLVPSEKLAQIWASFPKKKPGCLDVQEFAHMFEAVLTAKRNELKLRDNPFAA
jgi:hypothetical protein